MYIQSLELKNFKGIESMHLEMNGKSTVLFGINGVGKSSALLAANILFSNIINRIVANRFKQGINIELEDITFGKPGTAITGDFLFDTNRKITYYRGMERKTHRRIHDKNELDNLNQMFQDKYLKSEKTNMPILVNYGVNRSVVEVPLRIRTTHIFDKVSSLQNAIESKIDFRTFFEWFRYQEDFENEKKTRDNLEYTDVSLKAAKFAIMSFFEGFTNLRIERKPLAMKVTKNNQSLRIEQLSDGEKCTLALFGDLARRLALANPSLKNPLNGEGIALIDEIELHMHPQWQRKILFALKNTFPNIQFLITTHSPQVLGETNDEYNLFLLNRQEGLIKCNPFNPLKGWDSNAILEELMETSSINRKIKENIDEMFKLINEKRFGEAETMAKLIKETTNGVNEDVTRAQILIAKGRKNEKDK